VSTPGRVERCAEGMTAVSCVELVCDGEAALPGTRPDGRVTRGHRRPSERDVALVAAAPRCT